MRKIWTVAECVLLLLLSGLAYWVFPAHRELLRFWIPQIFLLLMIMVTSLYVQVTAELVSETRRLQNRPLLSVSFIELGPKDCDGPRFDQLYEKSMEALRGVARMIGGEQINLPEKSLAINLRNIGQTTARDLSISVKLELPEWAGTQKVELSHEVKKDDDLRVVIAPASLPYIRVSVLGLAYGDGLRNYIEYAGVGLYDRLSAPRGVRA